jgi:DNA-binding MarR family transcriptional regulator
VLELSSGGVTGLVQRLERDGHIVRQRHRSDGRSCVVALSSAALESGTALLDPLADDASNLFHGLNEAQRGVVLAFFRGLVEAAERRVSEVAQVPTDDEPRPAVPSRWA